MDKLEPQGFSDELIEFSKLISETFSNVSKDMIQLSESQSKVTKANKLDLDKLKKDILELKTSVGSLRNIINEVSIKVKKRPPIVESVKPVNNKRELNELKSELIKLKESVKNIEIKLKMD